MHALQIKNCDPTYPLLACNQLSPKCVSGFGACPAFMCFSVSSVIKASGLLFISFIGKRMLH